MADPWVDFENLRHSIKQNTVDKLKQILSAFNEQCFTVFSKSGKKQELIDRLTNQLDTWRQTNNVDRWTSAKAILYQVRSAGGSLLPPLIQHTVYPSSSESSNLQVITSRPESTRHYGPYNSLAKTVSNTAVKPVIQFRPSPFFLVHQAVSPIIECPESLSSTDRKQQSVNFVLNSEQSQKLKTSEYQLRLYCTSSTFHCASNIVHGPCPIEFPPTCEIRLNTVQLQANLKGLKKKPGTAPPPDLGRVVRANGQNRLEIIYVNSHQPVQLKKFYLVVMLVKITSTHQLVEKLHEGKYCPRDTILAKMFEASSNDEDIIAGPIKISLKCPLSFMRITSPCRSTMCVHSQCFDALSWFSVMEQTTTWLCPICERVLDYEDLIIDGYFDEILKNTPRDLHDVIVESDGRWHTQDAHSVIVPESLPHAKQHTTHSVSGSNMEVLDVDSDDEEESRITRELSVTHGSAPSPSIPRTTHLTSGEVIDLTMDSDDEESITTRNCFKRKAVDPEIISPNEQMWKKSRFDSISPAVFDTRGKQHGSTSSGYSAPILGATNESDSSSNPRTSSSSRTVATSQPHATQHGAVYRDLPNTDVYNGFPAHSVRPHNLGNTLDGPYPSGKGGASRPTWT